MAAIAAAIAVAAAVVVVTSSSRSAVSGLSIHSSLSSSLCSNDDDSSSRIGTSTPIDTTKTTTPRQSCEPEQQQQQQQQDAAAKATAQQHEKQKQQRQRQRTQSTWADVYYQQHGVIPRPPIVHATLPINNCINNNPSKKSILVIGDVHGCYQELVDLIDRATLENGGIPVDVIILVGDLVQKGPHSLRILQFIQQQQEKQQQQQHDNHVATTTATTKARTTAWYAVRGNHDDAVVAAALGDLERRQKPQYQWVMVGETKQQQHQQQQQKQKQHPNDDKGDENDMDDDGSFLSDEDVSWLAALPYTIRIPATWWSAGCSNVDSNVDKPYDIVIVHAGLVPNSMLDDQSITTMTTLRNVVWDATHKQYVPDDGTIPHFKRPVSSSSSCSLSVENSSNNNSSKDLTAATPAVPWASVWQGPFVVIFGHDARRGLQQYKPWAYGLDTGACYGKFLTGMLLPSRQVMHVPARHVYAPVSEP